ncbi:MAG: hypothetical protein WBH47_11080, partial [Streptosporangiaceae bacterium]
MALRADGGRRRLAHGAGLLEGIAAGAAAVLVSGHRPESIRSVADRRRLGYLDGSHGAWLGVVELLAAQ